MSNPWNEPFLDLETIQQLQNSINEQAARESSFQQKKQSFLFSGNTIRSPTANRKPNITIQPNYILDDGEDSISTVASPSLKALQPWSSFLATSPTNASESSRYGTSGRKTLQRATSRKLPSINVSQSGRGLVKSVDVIHINDKINFGEKNDKNSETSEQLIRDISSIFYKAYENRFQQQRDDEERRKSLLRISTPPELADDSYKSKKLYNDLVDDINSKLCYLLNLIYTIFIYSYHIYLFIYFIGVSNTTLSSQTSRTFGSRTAAIVNSLHSNLQQEISAFSSVALYVEVVQTCYFSSKPQHKFVIF
jgi:hypothetical protein